MIRKCNLTDLETVNKLGTQLFSNFTITYNVKDYLKRNEYIVLVNEDSNIINAFLIALKNIDFCELEAIYVVDDVRCKGIATKLLTYLIDEYLLKNEKIILEVAINNDQAINLYKKFDFKIINVRHKYYNGIDAYVMEKVK